MATEPKNTGNLKVIVSGGGTGGHIFPAVAIANEIRRRMPQADILFVGANGRMEMEKVPAAGFTIVGLPIRGLRRGLYLSNFLVPFLLISSLIKARKLLKTFAPDVAIGVGGYASGPLLHEAYKLGIPCVIQEQNSFPGITNRLLANKASSVCVAYGGMEKFFPESKIIRTGNPVRMSIANISMQRDEACAVFGLNPKQPVILVVGGSLGARTINKSIAGGLNKFSQSNVQLVWQAGKNYIAEAKAQAQGYKNVKVFDFIHQMDAAFACADIIVSRAGASTISELCIVGKPCILVPSPNVAEDHQTKNARALADIGAAVLVPDAQAEGALVLKAMELLASADSQNNLSANIAKLAIKDAASRIVNQVLLCAELHKNL
jgi:UDP-N-acetylglucosamine--N-acetylmuramyl-(pentapeptide) pyrophosphoryl-undecaprenol N-acetylglucosamine transferase